MFATRENIPKVIDRDAPRGVTLEHDVSGCGDFVWCHVRGRRRFFTSSESFKPTEKLPRRHRLEILTTHDGYPGTATSLSFRGARHGRFNVSRLTRERKKEVGAASGARRVQNVSRISCGLKREVARRAADRRRPARPARAQNWK